MARSILILFIALCSAAYAQVTQAPTGISLNADYRPQFLTPGDPEVNVLFYWLAVPNAVKNNVYDAHGAKLDVSGCPARPATPDKVTTDHVYADTPNPGWWKIPIADPAWKARIWCYWAAGVDANGKEGPVAGPFVVTVGNAGYVFFGVVTPGTYAVLDKCAEGTALDMSTLFPLSAYTITLFYVDPAGKTHIVEGSKPFFDGKDVAVIWHLPGVSPADGSIIPWNNAGRYYFRVVLNDGTVHHAYEGDWSPKQSRIGNYYDQAGVRALWNPTDPTTHLEPCTQNPFSSFFPQENVVTQ